MNTLMSAGAKCPAEMGKLVAGLKPCPLGAFTFDADFCAPQVGSFLKESKRDSKGDMPETRWIGTKMHWLAAAEATLLRSQRPGLGPEGSGLQFVSLLETKVVCTRDFPPCWFRALKHVGPTLGGRDN